MNSLDVLVDVYNQLAPRFRCQQVDLAKLEGMRAKSSLKDIMRTHGIAGWKLPFLLLAIRSRLKKRLPTVPVQPGIKDALQALKKQGIVLGILTSNSQTLTTRYLDQHGLLPYFEFVVGDYNLFGKDAALKKIIERHHFDPEFVYYIGDEIRDIEAAQRAHLKSIAVTWGFQTHTALARVKPTHIIDKPNELATIKA